ncbi:MAG: anthranilate synthase component 1, partial [Planctomycetota bacterium]
LVGYFGYECAGELEARIPVPEEDALGVPSLAFEAFASVCAFDHRAQTIVLSTHCRAGESGYPEAMKRLEAHADVLNNAPQGEGLSGKLDVGELRATRSADDFCGMVERLKHEIRRGEIFQAVPSRKLVGPYSGDLFALYRALRVANGAPHMFFFETDDVSIIGSSPERLIEVRGRRVSSVPIAGTRPRGTDPERDRELEAELLASRKERSEHDMLVDLARNDLGRVARIGTVRVAQHARVMRFRRVQHLVSRVEAELRSDRDALDALASCFPAGTVSGAPKIRAMQLIAELEGECRGPYAGAFGYLDHAGDLDTAICIRTFVASRTQLSLQAGAGIVHASDPIAELEEVEAKLAGPLGALELVPPSTTATGSVRRGALQEVR